MFFPEGDSVQTGAAGSAGFYTVKRRRNPRIFYCAVSEELARDEITDNIVCGRNAVLELLKSDSRIDTLYIALDKDDKFAAYCRALGKERGAVIKQIHPDKLFEICGSNRHQGLAASGALTVYVEPPDILDVARGKGENPFIILVDGVEDPYNLGAIIRTAEVAGAHGVIIPKRGGVQVSAAVHRASAGAVNHITIARASSLSGTVRYMKDKGLFCYAAEITGQPAFKTDLTGPILLIIGSEGFGVSRLLKELSDVCISLPVVGKTESLNASVAAGALIYEIVRQRMLA